MIPKRIQLKRTKGWKLPENTVVVSRPSKWGNPYKVGKKGPDGKIIENNQDAVFFYYSNVISRKEEIKRELKEKNLACWCSLLDDCHASILLEIANND